MNEHEQEVSRKVVARWKATQTGTQATEKAHRPFLHWFVFGGALLFGVVGGFWMFKNGAPRGQGSGSDFANGMVVFAPLVFAHWGAYIGLLLGFTIKLLAFLIAKVRKRRL